MNNSRFFWFELLLLKAQKGTLMPIRLLKTLLKLKRMRNLFFLILMGWLCPNLLHAQHECGTNLSPKGKIEYANWVSTVEKNYKGTIANQKGQKRRVPLKIHLVARTDGTGAISMLKVINDINQANSLFADADFEFVQCGSVNTIKNDAYYTVMNKSDDPNSDEQKMATAHKVSNALNVFYCINAKSSGKNASWSAFPGDPDRDWIVMRHSQSDNGSTFSHEIGHWFNLKHTFQGSDENVTRDPADACYNCTTTGDLLCDTPADFKDSNFSSYPSCNYLDSDTDNCATPVAYNPSPSNIMSYAGKCRFMFTQGQVLRMKTSYDNDRTQIHGTACSVVNSCLPPTASQLYTSNITNTTAKLHTTATTTNLHNFRYRIYGNTSWKYTSLPNGQFKEITGLSSGKTYQWQSRRECASGKSNWSAFESFQTTGGTATCSKPTSSEYSLVAKGSNSVTVECIANGIQRRFRYRKSGTTAWSYTPNTTFYKQSITGLAMGTSYQWQCRIKCSNGVWSAYSTSKNFLTNCVRPAASENSVTNITTNSADLNTANVGTHRRFRHRKKGTTTFINSPTTAGTKYSINGLIDGTEYEWQSRRKCNSYTPWSVVKTFTTLCAKPTAGQNYTNTIRSNKAKLNCTASGSYRKFRYRKAGTSTFTYTGSTSGSFFIITGLSPSTDYQWQSRKLCSNGWSPYSSMETFKTACSAPTAISNTTTKIYSTNAQLNCSATGTKFQFLLRKKGTTAWTMNSGLTTAKFKKVTGLAPSTTYEWLSRRYCGGYSNWSPIETFTTSCPAPTAANNTTTVIRSKSAKLNCSASGSKYQFLLRKKGTTAWTTNSGVITDKFKAVNGLTPSTTYEWLSRRFCSGYSSWSPIETFKTSCSAPTAANNTTTTIRSKSAKLNCSASGSKFQFLLRKKGATVWIMNSGLITAKIKTVTGLTPSTTYEWLSRRYCGGYSSWSPIETFTTSCSAPTAANNTTSIIRSTTAQLNCSSTGTKFQFLLRKKGTTPWTMNSGLSTAKFKKVTGLTPSTTYEWISRRYCGGYSNWSPIKTFKTSCSAPTASNNTTTNITVSSAKLNSSASGTKFQFLLRKKGTTTWTTNTGLITAKSKTVTGLAPATTYEWITRRYCSGYSDWSPRETFTTTVPVCNPPTAANNYTSNITQTSAWLNSSATAIYTQFRYRKSGATSWTTTGKTTGSFFIINSLAPGTNYQWQSKRECTTNNWSGWSSTETFKTVIPPCYAPYSSNNYTSAINETSARLNCNAPALFVQFRYRKAGTYSWNTTGSTSGTFFIITNLSSGTNYQWQSRKECSPNNWSGWSPSETFTTDTPPCSAPSSNLNYTTSIGNTSAWLNCNATALFVQFRYRKSGSASWNTTGSTSGTKFYISSLDPGTNYQWQSRRECTSNNWSTWSYTETFKTTAPVCYAPSSSNNFTTSITKTSAWLNCTASAQFVQFQYRKVGTFVWNITGSTSGTNFFIGSLTPGTNYEWQSRRECTPNNWSGWSYTKTFTTDTDCYPPANYQNSTSHITSSQARLNCTATAYSYRRYRYRNTNNYSWTTTGSSTLTYFYITGLYSNSNYEWQSAVECISGGWSDWSATEYFTTSSSLTDNPEPPVDMDAVTGQAANSKVKSGKENLELQLTELEINLTLMPNPVVIGMPVELKIEGGVGEAQILISSSTGERVSQRMVSLSDEETMVRIPPIHQAGLYLITVQSGTQLATSKLIIIE